MKSTIYQRVKRTFLALTVLGLLLPVYGSLQAAERTITITPPVNELTIEKGRIYQSTVTVKNGGQELVMLEAFVRDFVASPPGDSPRILGEEETSSYSLKNWLLLGNKQFVLEPGSEQQVVITIAVPQDAEPGGHYGLVGFTEANNKVEEGIAVQAGIAALFLVTVPGDSLLAGSIERLAGPSFTTLAKAPLSLTLKNGGNVHFRPSGFIRINDTWGRQVAEIAVNQERSIVLPDSQRVFSSEWPTSGAFGFYRARAVITLPESGDPLISSPITIWVFPIRTVGIGLLALLIAVLIAYEIEHLRLARRAVKEREA